MEITEETPIGKLTAKDIIDYVGLREIIKNIPFKNAKDYYSLEDVLEQYSPSEIVGAHYDPMALVDCMDINDVKDYVDTCTSTSGAFFENSFYVEPKENIKDEIIKICRKDYPKGYIGKKEAKEIIGNMIDFYFYN